MIIKLQTLRESRNLTQKGLSAISNVPQQTISAIESGDRKNPGIITLIRLANALQCEINDIFEEDDQSPTTTEKQVFDQ